MFISVFLQRFASFFDLLIVTRASAAKMFNFFLAHPGPDVRVQTSIIQGQARSACKLYGSKFVTYAMTWSVSTLLLIAVAIMAS